MRNLLAIQHVECRNKLFQAQEREICSHSSIQNVEIDYSRPRKAKSARIPASRMQKQIIPGLGKRNLLAFQHLECRSRLFQAQESEICSHSSIQNVEINYSRPRKAKSARIPASRMQKQITPGLGKRNLLAFQHLKCRNKLFQAQESEICSHSSIQNAEMNYFVPSKTTFV